jgi:hypothetical protein
MPRTLWWGLAIVAGVFVAADKMEIDRYTWEREPLTYAMWLGVALIVVGLILYAIDKMRVKLPKK